MFILRTFFLSTPSPLQLNRLPDALSFGFERDRFLNYISTTDETDFYASQYWALLRDGGIKVPIHKEYPFTAEGVRQAQMDIRGRGTTGKLVVDIGGGGVRA